MDLSKISGEIWFDGEMVDWQDANTHLLTHTLHYGLGVFEGVRAYATEKGPSIFRLDDHTDRLFKSAATVNMNIPYSKELINEAHKEVVKANSLKEAYIRPMCFYGSEGMGLRADNLKEHLIVAAWEWGSYFSDDNLENGIRIKTSSYTRHHVNATMCKAKANGNYINSMLALQEALSCGYDEALLLDVNGYVAEGSGENIFIINDNTIYTPEVNSALDGITRRTVMKIAEDEGIEIKVKNITRDEIYISDEAFFTGTAAEVTPIRELDDRSIGNGSRGPITKILQKKFFDIVNGKSEKYKNWLTIVK